MIAYIDGEAVTFHNDVMVVLSDRIDEDEESVDLHVKVTHEGVITDVVKKGEVCATAAYDADCLIEDCH